MFHSKAHDHSLQFPGLEAVYTVLVYYKDIYPTLNKRLGDCMKIPQGHIPKPTFLNEKKYNLNDFYSRFIPKTFTLRLLLFTIFNLTIDIPRTPVKYNSLP